MCTMQAPHRPVPQPNLVPVSFRPSRITHNNGVAGGASVDAAWPFTVKSIGIAYLLGPRGRAQPWRGACPICGGKPILHPDEGGVEGISAGAARGNFKSRGWV